jgi:hypothetical protein
MVSTPHALVPARQRHFTWCLAKRYSEKASISRPGLILLAGPRFSAPPAPPAASRATACAPTQCPSRSSASALSPTCRRSPPPTPLVVLGQLKVVAQAVHPDGDVADAGPGVEPRAERPESPVIRRPGKPGESECCQQKLAALVEHGYSMTWSAWRMTVCGIVRPSAFAVLRLMTSSNFVGCSTGRSAGLAPFRILSTYRAARPHPFEKSAP